MEPTTPNPQQKQNTNYSTMATVVETTPVNEQQMNEGRRCVERLVDFYARVQELDFYLISSIPGPKPKWTANIMKDFCAIVSELTKFRPFINEEWFKEHHNTIFNKLLTDLEESSCEFAKDCILLTGTISEEQRKFIDTTNERLLKPLTEMRDLAGVRMPFDAGDLFRVRVW